MKKLEVDLNMIDLYRMGSGAYGEGILLYHQQRPLVEVMKLAREATKVGEVSTDPVEIKKAIDDCKNEDTRQLFHRQYAAGEIIAVIIPVEVASSE